MFGYQVAFCWRNTAIYGGVLLFGSLYGLARDRDVSVLRWLKRPIRLWVFLLFLLPMVLDGISHMLGLRAMAENVMMDMWYGSLFKGAQVFSLNWWIRIFTGLLAALGFVWFAFPRINKGMQQSEALRLAYRQQFAAPTPQQTLKSKQLEAETSVT